ncbi:Dps family protein [Asticcacaulis endophyticus]|uniref:DNA starvation/stationary phase protection protein n=1 Tax=Asticcacaulis endophyticus TaxID=1395890 RepID=A0A918Q1M9_9CAUL|nr:Dps family protein [Asticcacaulis endophyticus]GGZ29219.1 DNA starvation/stationary phase protection protein [Asticcacaulis endophyticus]
MAASKASAVDHDKKVAHELSKLLADSYTLYQKTHGYHWNVTGPTFSSLHALFMEQYTEMWNAIDDIAERIRALGELAPQSGSALGNLTSIKDGDPTLSAEDMLKDLKSGHETVIATLKSVVELSEEVGDVSSADLATQRLTAHEKHLWMIKATLS